MTNDRKMGDEERYGLEILALSEIVQDDNWTIENRQRMIQALRNIHGYNIALFEKYMNAMKRLSMYE